jgi:hypothetical protein
MPKYLGLDFFSLYNNYFKEINCNLIPLIINNNLAKIQSINELNQRNKTRNKVSFDQNISYFNEQNNKQIVLEFDSIEDNNRSNHQINSKYF